ncbi:glutathione peroxidase [Loktanella sp. TSTF-M6]|uniref:Glutathione peroxidase n=1 Tax=Loktanella gaetbuli TaxID=2881335 RepID=A0ABS8BUV1_9RHOB|nr:glutathione peroxidase [Loktanella gaetbuli]MCB5199487.1 glutathione peroxidase [Loktanella gaetbuli]
MRYLLALLLTLTVTIAQAADPRMTFASIDGGDLALDDFAGQPVLVVNTASLCGFAGQLTEMQTLHETYRDAGLVVVAVPSDDFNQELETAQEAKEYCEMTYGLNLPMTTITRVRGAQAHPFYKWVETETGFVPNWNFNKVLLDGQGQIAGTWRAQTRPTSRQLTARIEALLN